MHEHTTMIEPRILIDTDEISLYRLLQLAMAEGLDLREVSVGYAGCGSHEISVWDMSGDHVPAPELPDLEPTELVPAHYDSELGF